MRLVSARIVFFCTYGMAAWSVGCADPLATPEPTARASQAVIGGQVSTAQDDAVVLLHVETDSVWSNCSATLVSPRIALTAKHCVSIVQPGSFVCRASGDLVQDGTGAGVFGQLSDPTSISVYVGAHPSSEPVAFGAKIFATGAPDACGDDVAAVVLDRPVPSAVVAAIHSSGEVHVGERVRLLGYGRGGSDVIMRRELSDVRITDVGTINAPPPDAAQTTPPRTFVIDGNTVCYGDSGGPALDADRGAVVGIYSRITGDCFATESRNTYMLASAYASLFAEAFAATGEEPLAESVSEDAAQGGGGAGGSDAAGGRQGAPDAGEQELARDLGTDGIPDSAGHGAFKCAFSTVQPSRNWPGLCAVVAAVALRLSRRIRRRACGGAAYRTARVG